MIFHPVIELFGPYLILRELKLESDIYDPNDYRDRVSLWDWLAGNLPEAKWIIHGDFNMVENSQDKKRKSQNE